MERSLRFGYDSRNRQTKVLRSGGQSQENLYDAEGRRCGVKENGRLSRFVYHQGELLYERSDEREVSYHLGGGIEAAQVGSELYYYHQDEQLSTALLTDAAGRVRNYYRYDAFGGMQAGEEGVSNRIRYIGQQYDEISEQYYLRARYYNPVVGRFLQEDVYEGDGLNLYAYCRNNPVRYYDPSGYVSTDPYGSGKQGGDGGEEVEDRRESEQVLSAADVVPFRDDMTPEEIIRYDEYWKNVFSVMEPGPFAGESIPASGKSQKFTVEERQKVSEIGYKTGCHTCGTTNPGTKSGFFVPDHQPVSDLVPDGTPQKLYPQCLTCSRVQGGTTRALNSKKNVQKIKPK